MEFVSVPRDRMKEELYPRSRSHRPWLTRRTCASAKTNGDSDAKVPETSHGFTLNPKPNPYAVSFF